MASNKDQTAPELTIYSKFDKLFLKRNVAENATHVIPHLKPNSRILDFGCGAGTITLDLARRCPRGEVVGIDVNHESIASANKAAQAAGFTNISFQTGDVASMADMEPDSFDIIHAHQVMLHLKDPLSALKSMHRLLKPNGILAIRDTADTFHVAERASMTIYREHSIKMNPQLIHAGRTSHVWVHQAGFPLENIQAGCAGWGFSGLEGRRLWADGMVESARRYGPMMGLADESFYDTLEKEFGEWAEDEAARHMAMDGWVIAVK